MAEFRYARGRIVDSIRYLSAHPRLAMTGWGLCKGLDLTPEPCDPHEYLG